MMKYLEKIQLGKSYKTNETSRTVAESKIQYGQNLRIEFDKLHKKTSSLEAEIEKLKKR